MTRERKREREKRGGRHRLSGGEREDCQNFLSSFLWERRSEGKKERKDFGEGQRWRCAS